MIEYIVGDIFTSPAQVIVNAVNTVGVMGKGIALEYKNRYPRMFEIYKEACEKRKFQIGKLMLIDEQDHQILLFPTKESWRLPSKIEYIEKGLKTFAEKYTQNNITSIAFPKLGCGNGGLSWGIVKPMMEKYLKELPIDIYIYIWVLKRIKFLNIKSLSNHEKTIDRFRKLCAKLRHRLNGYWAFDHSARSCFY